MNHLSEILTLRRSQRTRALSVLVIEDEPGWSNKIRRLLEAQGWSVVVVDEIAAVAPALETQWFDLMIIDRQLPDGNGIDLIARLRADGYATPMIVLTGMHGGDLARAEAGTSEGLNLGADDYVTKPFSDMVLLSRIQALTRRNDRAGLIVMGPLVIDFDNNQAHLRKDRLDLLQRDLNVLGLLAFDDPEPVTKETFFRVLWPAFVRPTGDINNTLTKPVDVAISTLRKKLEKWVGKKHDFIVSIPPPPKSDSPAEQGDLDLQRAWRLNPKVLLKLPERATNE